MSVSAAVLVALPCTAHRERDTGSVSFALNSAQTSFSEKALITKDLIKMQRRILEEQSNYWLYRCDAMTGAAAKVITIQKSLEGGTQPIRIGCELSG